MLEFVARGGLGAEDFAAADAPPPNDDVARMTRAAQALLQEEATRENARIEEVTELVDDVLFVLFPGSHPSTWRGRRHRF